MGQTSLQQTYLLSHPTKNLIDPIEQDQRRVALVAPTHEIPEDHLIAQALAIGPTRGYIADPLPGIFPQAVNLH